MMDKAPVILKNVLLQLYVLHTKVVQIRETFFYVQYTFTLHFYDKSDICVNS
jgi:hypothetical protein